MEYRDQKNRMFQILREFDNYARRFNAEDLRLLKSNIENNFSQIYTPDRIEDNSVMFGVYKRFLDIALKLYEYQDETGFPMAQMIFDYEMEINKMRPFEIQNNGDFIKSRLGLKY